VAGVVRRPRTLTLAMSEPSRLAARIRAIVAVGRARAPLGRGVTAALVAGAAGASLAVACVLPSEGSSESPAVGVGRTPAVVARQRASTIDPSIQAIADEELEQAVRQWSARAGVVLVLDPKTGAILANAGRADGVPADVATRTPYFPGSTMKIVTLAAALDDGVASPAETIDCEHGSWTYHGGVIVDPHAQGVLSLPEIVAISSNIGIGKLYDRIKGDRLLGELLAFHFGEAPPVEGAAPGRVPDRIDDTKAAGVVLAVGEGVMATPLQVAAAYAVLANGGAYVAPTLVPRPGAVPREQIIKPETARAIVGMLDLAVNGDMGTGIRARVPGVRVAGKTGTAEEADGGTYASFVGIVPEEAPRWIILVGVEQPRGDEPSGGGVAAPVFSRVAQRALGR
jgi:cell division protein FtsI (penicillin-binding protein 3)